MFSKKKDMVDLADLPKRNANLPYGKSFVPNDGCGFVDLTQKRVLPSELRKQKGLEPSSNSDNVFPASSPSSFAFFDSPTNATSSNNEQNDMMRKMSSQISDLDSKLYKMEQRIELLEKKAGVNNTSSSSGGFGW